MDAATLAAATPATRQRTIDLVRTASLGVVVLGHWLMAVVAWEDGRPAVGNALSDVPVARYATWVLQVMPLFFLVGGVANALSLGRWSGGDGAWLRGRAVRLLRPTAALLGVWAVVAVLLDGLGVDGPVVVRLTRGGTQPLWFLAVYLVVIAATPWLLRAHRRWGVAPLVALGSLAVLFDGEAPNYLIVWLLASQVGFWWADGTLLRWSSRQALGLAGGGLAALVALTAAGGYPVSMVGLPGERSNMSPPTVCIVALLAVQLGLLLAARPALERWLARPAVWTGVVRASAVAMTVFLWHLSALAIAAVPLLALGLPSPAVGSAAWWMLRVVWIVAPAAVLVGLVRVFAPLDWRTAGPPRPAGAAVGLAGVVAVAAGMGLVVTDGLSVVALAVVAGGAGLLRAPAGPPLPSPA
jgi:hypothetical protein